MPKGLKAVKPSKIINSQLPEDYLYTSEAISPKVYKRVEGQVKVSGAGAATILIPHNVGYAPINLVYINPTISILNTSFPMPSSWGLIDNNFAFASSNPSSIRLDIQNATANASYKYVCFIFVEPATNG